MKTKPKPKIKLTVCIFTTSFLSHSCHSVDSAQEINNYVLFSTPNLTFLSYNYMKTPRTLSFFPFNNSITPFLNVFLQAFTIVTIVGIISTFPFFFHTHLQVSRGAHH